MPAVDLDISALYERHRDELLVFLARRTTDAEVALELWAETFAQAIVSRSRYRGSRDEDAAAWLFAIARHQLARYYRRGRAERRAMKRLGIERPVLDPETEAHIIRRAGLDELRGELRLAVASLSVDVRDAITLRVIDEVPYPDVAARLAISEQAARARVSRGLRALVGHPSSSLGRVGILPVVQKFLSICSARMEAGDGCDQADRGVGGGSGGA